MYFLYPAFFSFYLLSKIENIEVLKALATKKVFCNKSLFYLLKTTIAMHWKLIFIIAFSLALDEMIKMR